LVEGGKVSKAKGEEDMRKLIVLIVMSCACGSSFELSKLQSIDVNLTHAEGHLGECADGGVGACAAAKIEVNASDCLARNLLLAKDAAPAEGGMPCAAVK
jgi:hypothetical protein